MEAIEVVIVGAGAVGLALAHELSLAGRQVVVLEENPAVGRGENQSTRNSGVIHAGLYYDAQTRPLKAALCPRGNQLLHRFCARHGVPFLACGKLVVATQDRELPVLESYLARAARNGVPAQLVPAGRVAELEPRVRALAALHLPTSGIVDAAALCRRLEMLAAGQGAIFLPGTSLDGVRARPQGLELELCHRDGARDRVPCRRLVNCAGLKADQVARLVDPASPHRVDPVRGEAYKFYRGKRPELALAGMNVYPTPRQVVTAQGSYFTVGVHLTPTLEPDAQGRPQVGPVVTVGPLNRGAASIGDLGGDFLPAQRFHREVAPFFPGLGLEDLEPHQVGVQTKLAGHQDWLVEISPRQPRCLNYLGIDSPGLTSCLALAELGRGLLERDPF